MHINDEVIPNPNISLSVFYVYETITVWPIRCFFDYHVVSFALTHSKTHQSDVIWCRQHGRRDHSSISTLMTTLLRKQWIITISPFVSDCTIGYNLSVSYNTRLKWRQKMPSHSIHVHAKIHLENFNSEHDIVVAITIMHGYQSLFDKSDVVRLSCRYFCNNTFENTLVRCNMMPPIRRTWPRFDIHINTLMTKLTVTLSISLSVFCMYGTITVWPIRCFFLQ